MKKTIFKIGLIMLFSIILFGSGSVFANNDGTFCFLYETEVLINNIRITYLPDNKIIGTRDVAVDYDGSGDFYGGSTSEFEGEISGTKITVNITIEIEGDIIHETQTWKYIDGVLTIYENRYTEIVCD